MVMLPKKRSRNVPQERRDKKCCKVCGAELSRERRKVKAIYCDEECRQVAAKKRMIARRPKQKFCTSCKKPLNMLSRLPHEWQKPGPFYCNEICVSAYRQTSGYFQNISALGNVAIENYQEKHGHVKNYEKRSAAVSANNQKAPPKAKHFVRHGRVWGYDATFYPDEKDDGYRATIAEFPDLIIHCKTMKEGLQMFREKFIEAQGE